MSPPAALKLSDKPDPIWIPGVDEGGRLYPIEKLDAHRRGALHLAVSVFVFDGPAMLIQRRAAAKYHSAGQWANTCCTHPFWGERAEAGARRRLREELGIDARLIPAGGLDYDADVGGGLREHERVAVFRAEVDRRLVTPRPNPDEVQAVAWRTRAELDAWAAREPEALAPWLRIYLARWPELGLD